MNQILITGEEQVIRNSKEKIRKPKKVLPIKTVAIFFIIGIMLFGICISIGSMYTKIKINETVENNMKPEITLQRKEDNTINIIVNNIRKITTLTYRWNDEEEIEIETEDSKNVNAVIQLIGGENTLTVVAIDENNQRTELEKTYIENSIPQVEFDTVDNGVKVTAKCEQEIEYLQYSWDDGEITKIDIAQKNYEGVLNSPTGRHTLKIEVVTVTGNKTTEEITVVGDVEPTLNIKSELINGKATFVIDAEDDENIKTVSITLNEEKQVIDVNDKTYHGEITMKEGQENRIIVTVTNENGLQKTRKVKFDNK